MMSLSTILISSKINIPPYFIIKLRGPYSKTVSPFLKTYLPNKVDSSIERLPTIFKLGNPNAPATQSNFVVLPVPEGP